MTPVAIYCESHLGMRVGGGECSHLSTESLRATGHRFAWFGTGPDYRWGQSIGAFRPGTTGPTCLPGDVLQYFRAGFTGGAYAWRHTAVVAEVDGGRPVAVWQENWNGVRVVTFGRVDFGTIATGRVAVYRPQRRTPVAGTFTFTITNDFGAPVRVTESASGRTVTYLLTAADTLASYQVRGWVAPAAPVVSVLGQRVAVRDAAAYRVDERGGLG